jgi:hypothetical protein
MKRILSRSLFVCFLLFTFSAFAQQNIDAEIRQLEKMEGEAFAKHDTATLLTLFSPQLVVNTPLNRVATFEDVMQLIREGKIDVIADEKFIEKITFVENVAIVMGYDMVKPQGAMANAGKTVKRRYTDIWLKDKNTWRLTARQATIISIN